MNPPTQGGHLLNGAGLPNFQIQPQQLQQLLQSGINTQQIAQLLSLQQQQPQPQPPQLNGFGAPSIATSLASQHAQLPPQFVLPSHMAPPIPQPVQQAPPTQAPSLPWPTCTAFPLTRVPYFDVNTYKSVNLDVSPSCDPNGLDLPLGDMNTLRFFFNLGVQQSKVLMLASKNTNHNEVQVTHVPQQPSINVMDQLGLNNTHLLRQMAAQQQAQQAAAQQAAAQQAAQQAAAVQTHVSQTPVMHTLTQQQQQLAQQNQILLATAKAHGLTERHLAQFGIQTPEIVQLAAQSAQQVAQSTAPMTVLPTAATVTPAMTRATPTAREYPSAKSSVGPDQAPDASALMLHQALLNINKQPNVTSSLHEARIQQLLGQQVHQHPIQIHQPVDPMLKAAVVMEAVLKPVAVGGGSGDAAVSPRPPIPVDPSPPKALIEATRNQQAQTSPPTSLPTSAADILLKPKVEPIIGAHRPSSARELPTVSIANGVAGKTSAPPSIHPDDASTHLFHVSEKHFTEAFTKSAQPQNPIGIARQDGPQPSSSVDSIPSSSGEIKKEEDENKPALAPILMMSFLNSCMSTMKHTLNNSGVPITVDSNGQPVDYSSRPVDKIFQQARQQQQMNNIREMSPMKRKSSPISTQSESVVATEEPAEQKRNSPVVKVDADDRSDSGSEGGGKRLRIATDEE